MFTEITHITKPRPLDPYERIEEVGGMVGGVVVWRNTLDEAIAMVDRGDTTFYVRRFGKWVMVEVVRGATHLPYLRTLPDASGFNNLLSLPQLPYQSALARGGLFGALQPTSNALLDALRNHGTPS